MDTKALSAEPSHPKNPLARTWLVPSLAAALLVPALAHAASLTPSRPSLLRQVEAANDHGFTYAYDDDDVEAMLALGELVRLPGNSDYSVKWTVSQPYARPEVKLFVERLADQYRAACGHKLVVTSLVRPKTRQPSNSSPLSVHPTGMAMDLRVSGIPRACRSWLERALLNLERRGVLEAARERHPPHFHVVLFPDPYVEYVVAMAGPRAVEGYRSPEPGAVLAASGGEYRVRRGDSLWTIARRFGTTTGAIMRANGLSSSRLQIGQRLAIPGVAAAPAEPTVVAAVATSAPAPAPAAETAPEPAAAEYRVRAGDSLWSIAQRFDTTVSAIQHANGLRGTAIKPGQVLTVPVGAGDAGPVLAQYRVRRGDSLWEIAQRHGTSPRQIQRVNGLSSSRIRPGQVLTIPTAAR